MTPTKEQIIHIIEKATWAPSGDNSQPWSFEWSEGDLKIYHNNERGKHPLNPKMIASFLSLGTLLTAIDLAASDFNYSTHFNFKNLNENMDSFWVRIQFLQGDRATSPLSHWIQNRTTDRRKFNGGQLDSSLFSDDIRHSIDPSSAQLHFVSPPSQELIQYIVNAEQILMDDKKMLPATLDWVRFSLKAAKKDNDGMLWRNMQIRFWELPMIPILRDVPNIIKILGPLIRPQNYLRVKQQLQSSAGLVCVSIPKAEKIEPLNIINAGQLMMQAWLSLTQKGYGVQPLTISSTISLCSRKKIIKLATHWEDMFKIGESIIDQGFSIPKNREAVWMVRTGLSSPLPLKLRTFRKPASEVLRFK